MLERKALSIGQESKDSSITDKLYSSSKVHDSSTSSDPNAQVYDDSYVSVMQIHVYVCTDCGKKYKWLDSLKRHQRVDCGNKEKKFSCHVCERKFKYRYELRNHISAHHNGWPSFVRMWLEMKSSARIKRMPHWIVICIHWLKECSECLWLSNQ